jgi:hypothetical protein
VSGFFLSKFSKVTYSELPKKWATHITIFEKNYHLHVFHPIHYSAIRVVEFSSGGYKIRKIFALKSIYPKGNY